MPGPGFQKDKAPWEHLEENCALRPCQAPVPICASAAPRRTALLPPFVCLSSLHCGAGATFLYLVGPIGVTIQVTEEQA